MQSTSWVFLWRWPIRLVLIFLQLFILYLFVFLEYESTYRYKFVISEAIKKLDKQWNIYSTNILFSNHYTLAPKEMGVYLFILVCMSVCLSVINILSHFSQQLIIAGLMYLLDFLFNADVLFILSQHFQKTFRQRFLSQLFIADAWNVHTFLVYSCHTSGLCFVPFERLLIVKGWLCLIFIFT